MTREDYCSYEIAKLLKEKGFDVELQCDSYYEETQKQIDIPWQTEIDGLYPHCTHALAMKWLREKHVIIVIVPAYFNSEQCVSWDIDIWVNDNYEHLFEDYSTYEEAVEAALNYCLTKLDYLKD